MRKSLAQRDHDIQKIAGLIYEKILGDPDFLMQDAVSINEQNAWAQTALYPRYWYTPEEPVGQVRSRADAARFDIRLTRPQLEKAWALAEGWMQLSASVDDDHQLARDDLSGLPSALRRDLGPYMRLAGRSDEDLWSDTSQ